MLLKLQQELEIESTIGDGAASGVRQTVLLASLWNELQSSNLMLTSKQQRMSQVDRT